MAPATLIAFCRMRWIMVIASVLLAGWVLSRLVQAARTGEMSLNFRPVRLRRHPVIFLIALVAHLALLYFAVRAGVRAFAQ